MFRTYFAVYAREQAYCHFSPALDLQSRALLERAEPAALMPQRQPVRLARRENALAILDAKACEY